MTFYIHINRLKLFSIERLFAPWMFTYKIIIIHVVWCLMIAEQL